MAKDTDKEQSVIQHLEELRRALIISIAAIVIMSAACYGFSDQVLEVILKPVTSQGHELVFIHVAEAFMTKIKLALFLGFLAALPIVLWQVWAFIKPALHKHERKYFIAFLFSSVFLFYAGITFCFFGVYQWGVRFLLQFAGSQLLPMLTIGNYVSFTIGILLPVGFVFELPLAAYFLSKMGIVSYALLARMRKYAFFVSIILGAALTPTDILTCLLMAGPLYLLYEFSVFIARMVERGKTKKAREEEAAEKMAENVV
ncbi:MAG: twin-arginine translocase subunit TatC [Peptococcaceae bacterium]|nr:twin-arginine translocase subunit TatC [Peptococcaceae bacterium]